MFTSSMILVLVLLLLGDTDREAWRLSFRFGAQFRVPMPDRTARKQILELILRNHEREMPDSVNPALLEVLLCTSSTHPGVTKHIAILPNTFQYGPRIYCNLRFW